MNPLAWKIALPASMLLGAWQAGLIANGLQTGRRIASQARPYQATPERVRLRVLLVGDSTGIGVGAGHPQRSLAGRLARRYPDMQIVNRCDNGARVADIAQQLARTDEPPAGKPFDLALVLAGGNDVVRLTPLHRLRADGKASLAALRARARRIVWLGCANIGASPNLLPPLSWWLARRTRNAMDTLARTARADGVEFIDFCRYWSRAELSRHAGLYFAADGFHPSAVSYLRCVQALERSPTFRSLRWA